MSTSPSAKQYPRATLGVGAITFLNSLATGVLWNGLGFITKAEFHFTEVQTYILYISTGAVYALAALLSGRLVRMIERHTSARALLLWLLLIQAGVAPLVYLQGGSVGLVIIAMVTSVTGALLWPVVESYVAAGKNARDARHAIGNWCLIWMVAVAIALVLMGPLQQANGWLNPKLALAAIAPISLLSICFLSLIPSHPAAHHAAVEPAPAGYEAQLRSARVILPAAYLLVGTISPLMPYLLSQMKLAATSETPLTATWLATRVVVVGVMARAAFWHGKWSALLCGALLMAGGFAFIVIATGLPALTAGLIMFGAGHGIIYYAALYYALRVGSAQIDAGAVHETLIGLGYVIGPAAGLAGHLLGGGAWTIALLWVLLSLAAIPAIQPWLRTRRGNRVSSPSATKLEI